jgi:cytochrome P450
MTQSLFSAAGVPVTCPEGGPPYALRAYTESPYPWYAWHRAHRPVLTARFPALQGGTRTRHYFFRHADVSALMADPRLGRQSKFENMDRNSMPPAYRPFFDLARSLFVFRDPPEHTRMRRAVQFLFDARRLKMLEGDIQNRAHLILDGLPADREFDVVSEFAVPLVLGTAQKLSGITGTSPAQLYANAHAIISALGGGFDDARIRAGAEAASWFRDTVQRNLAADGSVPRDGWIGELATAVREGSELRTDELVGTLILLILAASDNTVGSVGNALSVLLRNPASWQVLREKPELCPAAVHELLRMESPVQSVERYPSAPFSFAGFEVQSTDTVVLMLGSANRDENAFPEPERLDFERPRGLHATFGFGIHACLGAMLARLLLTSALQVLTARFRSMTLAEPDLSWRQLVVFRGLQHLRVRGSA